MKIAVVCANGKAGKLIVKEAVDRGHDVTAVVRSENQTVAQHTLAKDLFDLTSPSAPGRPRPCPSTAPRSPTCATSCPEPRPVCWSSAVRAACT